MKEKIAVSACLLGEACRYDGKSKPCDLVIKLQDRYDLIPICPEILGGLSTPRLPCERQGDTIIRCDGKDCTHNYREGAKKALEIILENRIQIVILKEKSPSCGTHRIYDGTFSNNLIKGEGISAEEFRKHHLSLYSEDEIETLLT